MTKNDLNGGKFALNAVSWSSHDPKFVLIGSMDGNCYLMCIADDRKSIDV